MVNILPITPVSSPSVERKSSCLSKLVSMSLEKIIGENFRRQLQKTPIHSDPFVKFQSSYEPDVTIEYYIERIFKHSKCSDSCLIIMLIYIDRLIESKGFSLTRLNAHRMIVASLMLASKYHDDIFYNNAYFAKLGGIPVQELNALEVELLQLHEFSMFVGVEVYDRYFDQLLKCQHFVQYGPSIGSPQVFGTQYSTVCENPFQFSPHRQSPSFTNEPQGYFVSMANPFPAMDTLVPTAVPPLSFPPQGCIQSPNGVELFPGRSSSFEFKPQCSCNEGRAEFGTMVNSMYGTWTSVAPNNSHVVHSCPHSLSFHHPMVPAAGQLLVPAGSMSTPAVVMVAGPPSIIVPGQFRPQPYVATSPEYFFVDSIYNASFGCANNNLSTVVPNSYGAHSYPANINVPQPMVAVAF